MAESFHNIIDYVWEHGEPFGERGLCRVDSLVLSQLCYCLIPPAAGHAWDWDGLPLHELWRADWLDEMTCHMYDPPGARRLLAALAASPRFRDVLVCDYQTQLDSRTQMQFAAMAFRLGPHQTYVAFRGTDNTIVGWKENLNMAFQVEVPSQTQALRYLERVAARTTGDLWVGGHSKGGNMAIYAAMVSPEEVRTRIACCFSHDGPGFTAETLARLEDAAEPVPAKRMGSHEDDGAVQPGGMQKLPASAAIPDGRGPLTIPVDKTVPKSSVFGMLFDGDDASMDVVRSASSGFAQHDPLSWEVDGCDFALEERLGRTASYVDSSLNAWIDAASLEERAQFVEAVGAIMDAPDEKYTHDIRTNWRNTLPDMARAAIELDPEIREVFVRKVLQLVRELAPGGE
jgi:hypothetical protein